MPLQWGGKERAVDFFDVKGDIEALLAPMSASFVPAEHPALHPGRCARVELDGRPSASSANCIRAGARATSCRRRPCCSNSISTPCWRPGAGFAARQRQRRRDIARWWPAQVSHAR